MITALIVLVERMAGAQLRQVRDLFLASVGDVAPALAGVFCPGVRRNLS
jgi:hypothetical protein